MIIPSYDFYEGIITILYLILIGFMISSLYYHNITLHMKIILIIIIVIEGVISLGKNLLYIFFPGANKDYDNIRMRLFIVPCVISLPISAFCLFILITQIHQDSHTLCVILSYILLSSCRVANTYSYLNLIFD